MGLFNFIDPLLNLIFNPLHHISPFFAVAILSLFLSFLITVIYKYTSNQKELKEIKKKQKDYNKKLKALKTEPEKAMKVQKEMMALSGQMMKHSFKPMIYTFIPVIIIFAWLANNFAYDHIAPGDEFTTTITFPRGIEGNVKITVPEGIELLNDSQQPIKKNKVNWKLKGPLGDYILMYDYNTETYTKKVKITDDYNYEPISERKKTFIDSIYSRNSEFLSKDATPVEISINNKPLKVLPFKIIKWDGWLITYILFSLIFSTLLRKIMKVN